MGITRGAAARGLHLEANRLPCLDNVEGLAKCDTH